VTRRLLLVAAVDHDGALPEVLAAATILIGDKAAVELEALAPAVEARLVEVDGDPSPIAQLGVTEILDHYDAIIRKLDQPAIIMGHSFGGLFTQILLDRGLGAAGVAIDSAPVKGILVLPFSTL